MLQKGPENTQKSRKKIFPNGGKPLSKPILAVLVVDTLLGSPYPLTVKKIQTIIKETDGLYCFAAIQSVLFYLEHYPKNLKLEIKEDREEHPRRFPTRTYSLKKIKHPTA